MLERNVPSAQLEEPQEGARSRSPSASGSEDVEKKGTPVQPLAQVGKGRSTDAEGDEEVAEDFFSAKSAPSGLTTGPS